MRTILLLVSAASLALGTPALAQGNGNGNGGGPKGHEAKAGAAHGGGNPGKRDQGRGQQRTEKHSGGNAAVKANENHKADGRPDDRREAKAGKPDRAENSFADRKSDGDRNGDKAARAAKFQIRDGKGPSVAGRDGWRDTSRLFVDRSWDGNRYRFDERAYLVPTASWCPPGLARKGNGCQPPGQARKLDRYDSWASWYPVRYRDDGYDWRYDNGYLYRIGHGGLVSALIPLIGGALFGGQVWPEQYSGYEAPAYYDRYYGYGDRYDYRIAQNAIFAVDPQTQQIDSIAGLLTGDRWSVGQRIPAGYDVYNVPLDYRDRYADRPDASYRYSDGYVYEVDPATQLVRAIIELVV